MKITVTKTAEVVAVNLENETNGNDLNINLTVDDARILVEKILVVLGLN